MELADLLESLFEGNGEDLPAFLDAGGDPNSADTRWNCSMLFHAIYGGDFDSVKRLVDAGADVNYRGTDPAPDILASTPLALAMQCRLMMDEEKYYPIVLLLEEHGAEQEIVFDPKVHKKSFSNEDLHDEKKLSEDGTPIIKNNGINITLGNLDEDSTKH